MITYSIYTDVGSREINEDSARVREIGDKKIFVVADGLGGHGRGEVASGLVADFISSFLNEKSSIKNYLEYSVQAAQDALMEEQEKQKARNEMKTTVVALMIEKNKAKWSHCGDSRLYRFYKNKMEERTLDHSIPQMLVLTHEIKEEEIRHHSERNLVLKVMGSKWEKPQYDVSKKVNIKKCQAFLLCTDGFWELITEDYMERFLQESKSVDEWMEKMAAVVKKNGENTNMDNNTAIAVWCD